MSAPDLAGSGRVTWWHHTRCCSPQIPDTSSACSSTTPKAPCLHFPSPLPKAALWEGAGTCLTSRGPSLAWLLEQDQGEGRGPGRLSKQVLGGPAAHPSLAVGCSREQGGQAGQYHTPSEQLLLGREHAPSSCGQPTGGSPIPCHRVPEPAASNPFFSQPLGEGGGWNIVQK